MLKSCKPFIVSALCALTPSINTAPPDPVIATVGVGLNPSSVAVTPNGLFAYVPNNNDNSVSGADTVSVINTTTNLLSTIISDPSFNQPYTVTINAAGTKAYVTNSNSTTITIIDIATNTVTGTITGFDGPSGMVIMPNGTTAYVNNYGGPGGVGSGNGTTVRVVNLNTDTITGPAITVGQAPAALAITPDGNFVYSINYVDGNPGTGTISVIDTNTNTIVATIPGFSGPYGIAITPDGNYAYVTNFGSNNFEPVGTTVSVIDLTTNTIINTIEVGIQPSGVAITPDGKYVYISNYYTLYLGPGFTDLTAFQGTINIIDTATHQVILPVINVGASPDYIAISPDGKYAYVTNYTSNNVNVIGIPLFSLTAQGCKTQNIFLTERDFINKLTWNVTGTNLPIKYSIYRDELLTQLVATVPASGALQFLDHNRYPNTVYTYYIVGINAEGITSYPVTITVTQNC